MEKKLTEQEKIQGLNKLLSGMLGAEPLVEYREPSNDLVQEWNYALAKMYADKGFRTYLENAVNLSTKSAVTKSDDIVSLVYNKARVIAFKELLIVSKNAFEHLNKLKNVKSKTIKEVEDGRTVTREEITEVPQTELRTGSEDSLQP